MELDSLLVIVVLDNGELEGGLGESREERGRGGMKLSSSRSLVSFVRACRRKDSTDLRVPHDIPSRASRVSEVLG